ncbi:zona pellucida sperm-binding protein 4-like [Embiotoca jacksoni]|uniref:zona pellucida sperm-binding protein 4-like n=1 Tax=Embiotoca jacksoni TaxID=100190 RepID=UPI003703B2D1
MELFKYLFGVVFLSCDIAARSHWTIPVEQSSLPYQWPQQHSTIPPPAATFDKCQVEEAEKIRCGTPDLTAEQCETRSCCFDGGQCYYGKAVTVQCTRDGQFVVVVAKDATLPAIDVSSISLIQSDEPGCTPVGGTSAFAIFQIPVTACGTTMKVEDGYVVYENHMSSSYEVGVGPKGSITRDSHFELLFQCRYSGTAVEALALEVNALPPPVSVAAAGPLRVELRFGNGQCYSNGCVEDSAAFSSYYSPADYPITKMLREPVYVEVHLLEGSDSNVILNLEHCWATSDPHPNSLPQCPYNDDRYLTTLVPVDGSSGLEYPTHYKRFIIRMFTFVDPSSFTHQKDMVFIHCTAAACYPDSTNACEQPCYRKRRAAGKKVPSSQRALVSSSEVILTELRTGSVLNTKK